MILMHPWFDFKKHAINLNISFIINHQKPRNRNNKGSFEISMVLIPSKVFLKLKLECKKKKSLEG
jgi:hypothetical protein